MSQAENEENEFQGKSGLMDEIKEEQLIKKDK